MMNERGLILHVKAKQVIDPPYLAQVVKEFDSCWGMAFAAGGSLQFETTNEAARVDVVNSLRKFDDTDPNSLPMSFFFGSHPDKFSNESVQPIPVLYGAGDKPELLAFIEGDFTKYKDETGNKSAEFWMARKFLLPKFAHLFRLCGNDMAKFMEELKQESIRQDVLNAGDIDGRVTVHLLASGGQTMTIARNNQYREFPWGMTSHDLGLGKPTSVPQVEQKKDEPPKQETLKERSARIKAENKTAPIPESVPKEPAEVKPEHEDYVPKRGDTPPSAKAGLEPLTDRVEGVKEEPEYEYVLEKPPENIKDKNPLRQWYETNWWDMDKDKPVGHPPQGYRADRPAVLVRRVKAKTQKTVIHKTLEAAATAVKGMMSSTGTSGPSSAVLPIISMGQEARFREEMIGDLKKFVGLTASEIADPASIPLNEERAETFTSRFGMKNIFETWNWPPQALLKMIKEQPEIALAYMLQLKYTTVAVARKAAVPLYTERKQEAA